jgi:acetyl-CoA acyltransferase 1
MKVPASPPLFKRFGLIGGAFASQSVYCMHKVGLDPEKVNPNGGAIALGRISPLNFGSDGCVDPLGATGGRLIATILAHLGETGGKFGVTSMCASTGQGMATLVVRE